MVNKWNLLIFAGLLLLVASTSDARYKIRPGERRTSVMAARRSVSHSYAAGGRSAHRFHSVSGRRAMGYRPSVAASPGDPSERPSAPPPPRADFGLRKAYGYRYAQPAPPPAQTPPPSIRDDFLSRMARKHERSKKRGDWRELPTDRVILHGDIGEEGQPYHFRWSESYGALSDPAAHNRDQGGKPVKKVKK